MSVSVSDNREPRRERQEWNWRPDAAIELNPLFTWPVSADRACSDGGQVHGSP